MLTNFVVLCLQVSCWDDSPIVATKLGRVQGELRSSFSGKEYVAFEGIPYAQPPIGDLRFRDPLPAQEWSEILKPKTTTCVQLSQSNTVIGTEDCLHLNVYTPSPKRHARTNLDVVVHIHGGIILVTINFRLGILGFLSTEDELIPGNFGLKDQVLALQWIQDNIKSFGGNPMSVTLTGLESGAAAVHLHYFSPLSRNLFHRGISQSGTALNHWALQKEPGAKAKKLAIILDCPISDQMLECLRGKSAEVLTEKTRVFQSQMSIAPFGPVVEKVVTETTFLHDHPYRLLLKGEFADVPWVVSNVADEGAEFVKSNRFDYLEDMFGFLGVHMSRIKMLWKMSAPIIFDFRHSIANNKWNHVSGEIYNFYINKLNVPVINGKILAQMIGDRFFVVDTETAVRIQSKRSKSNVYYYRFQYATVGGQVSQGSDTRFMFPNASKTKPTKNDLLMMEQFQSMLVSYASDSLPKFNDAVWEPTEGDEIKYLEIISPTKLEMKTEVDLDTSEFWNGLGFRENQNLFRDD